jgi:kynurenine formamidase
MPPWQAAGDPPYSITMTDTPRGSVNDNLSGAGAAAHERHAYCGDEIHMYTHCGTHGRQPQHLGHNGKFWNG